ncbi:MAG: hypothetical protein QGH51_00915 [Planctomycetota bacterium]|jgi:hypothetical protein|nr:hypothetical protein [Planctomycetota bacterium]
MTTTLPPNLIRSNWGRLFLSTISLAFIASWILSVCMVWNQYGSTDHIPGLSLQDVRFHFNGNPNTNRFSSMTQGDMLEYFTVEEDSRIFINWSRQPAQPNFSPSEHLTTFQEVILPVLEMDCLECHEPGGKAEESSLRTYEEVLPHLERDRGIPIPSLLLMSHIHLFGMGLLSLASGLLAFRFLPISKAGILSALTGLGLLLDVCGWWATKFSPDAAPLVILGATLFGGAFLLTHLSLLRRYWRP